MKRHLQLTVNGQPYECDIEPGTRLVEVLRDESHLTGTKTACTTSSCGTCTVLLEGKPVKSCSVLAMQANGKHIQTIEGLASPDGKLHPVQQAFIDNFAVQCGFCTPGMILTAKALLDEVPHPTEEEVRMWMVGNLCRCTGYVKIVDAILAASKRLASDKARR